MPLNEAARGLHAAMTAVVRQRKPDAKLILDDSTRSHIMQAARWLTDPALPSGLMMCGLCGNGKTTLATALQWLVGWLTERELGYSNRKQMRMVTAKEVCRLCAASEKFKEKLAEYNKLFNEELLIIDDLGEEPSEVMVFGMPHTPIVDLIGSRYARQRTTVVTTNLQTGQLRAKYGDRIHDRMREMLLPIVFENESYRHPVS